MIPVIEKRGALAPLGEATPLAGELVLVVDDGKENRDFVVDYVLTQNGYRAIVAKDGREALEMAAHHHPDLILLDYQMPRMNGIDVLRAMIDRNLQIPVILMTFYGSEDVAVEVYRLGVRDYVKKPFTVDEMHQAIERNLAEVRIRREKEAMTDRLIGANRELQNRLQELNVLYSVGKSVTSLMGIEQLLPRVVDAAVRLTSAEEGYLYLIEDDQLVCHAQKRAASPRAEPFHVVVQDALAVQVVAGGGVVNVAGAEAAPLGAVALACAPLKLRDEVIGVLGVRNVAKNGSVFTKHHSALLSALSDYAAIAIENARNMEALRANNETEKAQIRSTFQQFVPARVVHHALEAPNGVRTGGARQPVTILFADIRGYSAYAESVEPEVLIEMLNEYLSLAANVMMEYHGTIDKFLGDGLMVLFNAPDSLEDHPLIAARAALALQAAVHELAAARDESLTFSIGIHTGEAVVGYIGTNAALNYTAIGDAANVAKRLQEAARPGQILMEAAFLDALNGRAEARALGEMKFKGRQTPGRVYELAGLNE